MSKRKGKQMSNLPHSYIDAMEGLQIENEQLRKRVLKLESLVKDYDCSQIVINSDKVNIKEVINIENNTGDLQV